MLLKNIYKANIDRNINGVIKVAQNDETVIEQELSEYIITKELRKHFTTFMNNYEQSLATPTDKIGVWISGFFGSGKSHFLKILSYLLSNDIVAGKHAVDYFADKFDDQMMFAQLERCASVPTDTILFNIDSKSSVNKDSTAILRVFAKVFYEYRGFYGDDLKVARLEQYIAKCGKTEEFHAVFEQIHGDTWKNSRSAFGFFEDEVVETLMSVLGMSESAARNWFNGEETGDISIDQLVREIAEYIDSRGKDFRLLFMIDEVGQYIGSDGNLMLNLQTFVEEFGSQCGGRVWVMVTSQEAIDSVAKIVGTDFSKIQGRFNTRLSLSSSSVDEVIKKRILAKTDAASDMLSLVYAKNSAVLKNLFTFNNAVLDIKGYSGEHDFVETYPFVPYQFRLMQNVLAQIRKHGNSGKHLSGGERSMLSGFQEAAQKIENKDENALVPFWMFYDTVNTFLESTIRRVIDRCQTAAENRDGLLEFDVSVLKLLYLVRYIDDIKATVDNITTLLVDDIRTDKLQLRKLVQESLDRLVRQNYVARNGDTYTFLTDDEQDIEREIRNTPVDTAAVVQVIATEVFGSLYFTKKFKYDKYDFPFDQMVDDTVFGQLTQSGMRLHLLTVASDSNKSEEELRMKTSHECEALLVLSEKYPYFEEFQNSEKIRKYVKSRNISQLPEAIRNIIQNKQQQASSYTTSAKEHLKQAIVEAKCYVYGETVNMRATTIKEKFDGVLGLLVQNVYYKLGLVNYNFDSDDQLYKLLAERADGLALEGDNAMRNPEAVKEIDDYLRMQNERVHTVSVGDIQRRFTAVPYGWREIDIAAALLTLVVGQKVTINYLGNTVQPSDKRIVDYLRRKTDVDKTVVQRRIAIPEGIVRRAKAVLKEYFVTMDLPDDEDGLVAYVLDNFTAERNKLQGMLAKYDNNVYPGKDIVLRGVQLCDQILLQRKDNTALVKTIVDKENDLMDFVDDIADVNAFFANQCTVFDKAVRLLSAFDAEADYFAGEQQALAAIERMKQIVSQSSPYKNIAELPTLTDTVQRAYNDLLVAKRSEVCNEIRHTLQDFTDIVEANSPVIEQVEQTLTAKQNAANVATTLTALDAIKAQLYETKQRFMRVLATANEAHEGNSTENNGVYIVDRANVIATAKLTNQADVDNYIAELQRTLSQMIAEHGTIKLI